MKQFFKFVFASTLGVFLALFLTIMLFALVGVATGGGKTKITKNTV